eukprot:g29912.t1
MLFPYSGWQRWLMLQVFRMLVAAQGLASSIQEPLQPSHDDVSSLVQGQAEKGFDLNFVEKGGRTDEYLHPWDTNLPSALRSREFTSIGEGFLLDKSPVGSTTAAAKHWKERCAAVSVVLQTRSMPDSPTAADLEEGARIKKETLLGNPELAYRFFQFSQRKEQSPENMNFLVVVDMFRMNPLLSWATFIYEHFINSDGLQPVNIKSATKLALDAAAPTNFGYTPGFSSQAYVAPTVFDTAYAEILFLLNDPWSRFTRNYVLFGDIFPGSEVWFDADGSPGAAGFKLHRLKNDFQTRFTEETLFEQVWPKGEAAAGEDVQDEEFRKPGVVAVMKFTSSSLPPMTFAVYPIYYLREQTDEFYGYVQLAYYTIESRIENDRCVTDTVKGRVVFCRGDEFADIDPPVGLEAQKCYKTAVQHDKEPCSWLGICFKSLEAGTVFKQFVETAPHAAKPIKVYERLQSVERFERVRGMSGKSKYPSFITYWSGSWYYGYESSSLDSSVQALLGCSRDFCIDFISFSALDDGTGTMKRGWRKLVTPETVFDYYRVCDTQPHFSHDY